MAPLRRASLSELNHAETQRKRQIFRVPSHSRTAPVSLFSLSVLYCTILKSPRNESFGSPFDPGDVRALDALNLLPLDALEVDRAQVRSFQVGIAKVCSGHVASHQVSAL